MMRSEEGDQVIDLNAEPESCVSCSICLDLVTSGGERSMAKLQCGHEFHLDCIGSAFNIKGKMQCPNCRNVEKGRWLYASGSTNSSPELSMDDGGVDSYPLYFSFAEMPYRVHICPFRGLTHVHPSSESSIGIMSTLTPMMGHQHPGRSPHPHPHPHPHGWVHFQHAPYHHHQQSSGLPLPRSLPRYMPPAPGRVYDPNPGFSLYPEGVSMNYSPAWGRDNVPHFP